MNPMQMKIGVKYLAIVNVYSVHVALTATVASGLPIGMKGSASNDWNTVRATCSYRLEPCSALDVGPHVMLAA